MHATPACDDCIVTFLLDRPEGAVIIDVEAERALRTLADAGLAPSSRYRPARRRRTAHPPHAPDPALHLPAGEEEAEGDEATAG
jgi:hypothetical protein